MVTFHEPRTIQLVFGSFSAVNKSRFLPSFGPQKHKHTSLNLSGTLQKAEPNMIKGFAF